MFGPFKPGFVTQAQADELNRLLAKVRALDRIGGVAPVTVTRGPGGQPVIAYGGASAAGGGGTPGDTAGGGSCGFAGLRTEDCVGVLTADGNFPLLWDSGASKWTSADEFTYPTGTGVFAFWYSAGAVHLSLDGLELLNCGDGCFSGGALTGHDSQTAAAACNGPAFTVCVECGACAVLVDCCPDPLATTLTLTIDNPSGGSCTCLGSSLAVTLEWNGSQWAGTHDCGDGTHLAARLECQPDGDFILVVSIIDTGTAAQLCGFQSTPGSGDMPTVGPPVCSPLSLVFSGSTNGLFPDCSMCGGSGVSYTFTVTE